jgi:hypothetical protein
MTNKLCLQCKNDYDVEAMCFSDDPNYTVCNGCYRSTKAPETLKVSVQDIPKTGDKFG